MPLRRRGSRAGNVAVEAALLTPVILLMLAGVADYGSAVREEMALTGAVRSGIQYAFHHSADPARVELAVRGAVTGDPDRLTVTVSQLCECADGAAVACTDSCTSGARRSFVRIDAQREHETLMPWPGIGSPTVLSAFAQVRIQ